MYCHKCGTKVVNQEAQFCSICGTELAIEKETNAPEKDVSIEPLQNDRGHEVENNKNSTHSSDKRNQTIKNKNGSSFFWPIAIPVISLIVAGIGSWGYYSYQQQINQEVKGLKAKAEEVALKGKYQEAISTIKEAQNLRPDYKILDEDKKQIESAIKLNKSLDSISESLKTQQLDNADKKINSFKDSLKEMEGPLFSPFHKLIDEKTTTLAVAKIKKDINTLSKVDQLSEKLTTLSSLQSSEKDEVQQLIIAKIVDISTKEAEAKLKEKQFNDALSTIDKGLEFSSKDTKLLSFKDRIQKEQTAFEKAEEQRIEQAMASAAQEDLKNKTAGVNVENINAELDEYGDLQVRGEVKNTATKPVSSITIYYDVYDESGNLIGSSSTYVNPFYLEIGQTGNFEDTYYGVYKDASVTITQVTWQLD